MAYFPYVPFYCMYQFALTTLHLNSALPLLRIARIFRMLAVLRLYRVVQSYRGFDYQLAVLVFLILVLIFVAAGVFQILEESYYTDQGFDPIQFHQAMSFVFVTLSTVGYGDISPHTTEVHSPLRWYLSFQPSLLTPRSAL